MALIEELTQSHYCGVGVLLRAVMELGVTCAPDAPPWVAHGLAAMLSRCIVAPGGVDAALAILLPVDASDEALVHLADMLCAVPTVRS